jgi:hypothetical protein
MPPIAPDHTNLLLVFIIRKPDNKRSIRPFHVNITVQAFDGLKCGLSQSESKEGSALADPVASSKHVDLTNLSERRE